ncbi:stress response translation initiation inhibitor YciH [Candidatus Micrarchaeota archaeon]|nr:stress response translation initiation inhibitor YciH [Candidatus Micrarchaeota archaeon]
MPEICSKCGLPKDICACQTIGKETVAQLKVYTTKKRFNKLVTIIEGLQGPELKNATKELKHKLACGGSHKEGYIVLQGNHKEKTVEYLIQLGYPQDAIKVR